MKTLFIAALVGLLVVPVVGTAQETGYGYKCIKCEEKRLQPIYNQAEREAKAILARGVEHLKLMNNLKMMIDSMERLAKNAPDKLQKDWALGVKANLAGPYNKAKIQFNKTNKDYFKAARHMCDQMRICWSGRCVNVSSPFGIGVCPPSSISKDQIFLNR